jgi:hypothetical protein
MEIYYVENMILETVWLEEKGGGSLASFVLTGISYRISRNMTRTDGISKSVMEVQLCPSGSLCWDLEAAEAIRTALCKRPAGRYLAFDL